MEKTRNSKIELIRLVAMGMIILSHVLPNYGNNMLNSVVDLNKSTTNINIFILMIYKYMGSIGNVLFIICSSYFLTESNNVKMKKIIKMVLETFIISVSILFIFLISGLQISLKDIIKQFFPILFQNNWFIGCYLLFYIIHPFLNLIIDTLDKKKMLLLNGSLCFLYLGIQFVFSYKYFFNELTGFIIIYLLVAYQKKYMKNFQCDIKKNKIILIMASIILVIFLFFINVLGNNISLFDNKILYFNRTSNPIIVLIGFAIFNLFVAQKDFENKTINYMSSLTIYVYLIHDNYIYRTYMYEKIFAFIHATFSYRYICLIIPPIAAGVGICSFILASIYKKVTKNSINKIVELIHNKILLNIKEKYLSIMMRFD